MNPRGLLFGVAAMSLVGSSVGVSELLVDAPLFTAQALRYAVATVVLAAILPLAGARVVRPRGREWLWLAGVAATGLVLFNVAIVRGVEHAEPAAIAVAVACVPVLLAVVGPMLEHRSPHRRVLAAALVVTTGSVLVVGAGDADPVGVAWAAVALGCEAGFTLLAVPVLARHSAWGVSFHSVWIGAAMFLGLGVVVEGPTAAARLDGGQVAALAYLAVLVTAVAFVLWYTAVVGLGAGRAGLLAGLAPVSAALAGVVLSGRVPGPPVWAGIAVVAAGLVLGLTPARRSPVPVSARARAVSAPAVGDAPP
ncbi:DMT family transporter [Nocardioides sp.]|uniref:DMT family transporter n=1 Tax=Nocardioides sp. TaxID=35761 RepID=UPI002ED8615D